MSANTALRCPCLAVEALNALPWDARMQAYSDYDQALAHWHLGRSGRRSHDWRWRLDMRRALRHWAHYKKAVRAAGPRRMTV